MKVAGARPEPVRGAGGNDHRGKPRASAVVEQFRRHALDQLRRVASFPEVWRGIYQTDSAAAGTRRLANDTANTSELPVHASHINAAEALERHATRRPLRRINTSFDLARV